MAGRTEPAISRSTALKQIDRTTVTTYVRPMPIAQMNGFWDYDETSG
jgi:hypothetical protein